MTQASLVATVGQLVVERPERARIFERFGIDYCCGGKKPLKDACAERGLDLGAVLAALEAAESAGTGPAVNWGQASLRELADHIETTHHAYLKQELPRLEHLATKVASVHGANHPELQAVRDTFLALKAEMETHMMKEERILFPMIREMEASDEPKAFHCGSVANPISVMVAEHDSAGAALDHMRKLTGDYLAPPEACNSYRALLAGLAELEADMHQHVHKENNVLFPRAVALEKQRGGGCH